MEVGMGLLQIPPGDFWNLTMREFWAIYYGRLGRKREERKAMSRNDLRNLMEKFPDVEPKRT